MVIQPQTGMDKAAMKQLLMKSKKEPVNCAVGRGANASLGVMLLDRSKQTQALMKDLEKAVSDATNLRYGKVVVDADEDPKLVKFYLNKAASGIARPLIKTLEGTGFSQVQILLEDGSLSEAAADEVDGSGSEQSGAPEAKALDADMLLKTLTAVARHMVDALKADPSRKDALTKLAVEAQASLKAGELARAAASIQALARALGQGAVAP